MSQSNYLLFAVLILFYTSCSYNSDKLHFSLKDVVYSKVDLEKNDSTFYIEKGLNHYQDNIIYDNCKEITYEYNYQKNGEVKYFAYTDVNNWKFVTHDSLGLEGGVKEIKLSALNPNQEYNYTPQSTITYKYFDVHGKAIAISSTGVVENYKNILIHNPREGFFWQLFPFPWPSVRFPLEVGAKWNWQWGYNGNTFGDKRFTDWEGIVEMKFEYKVIKIESIELDFGHIQCYKILAVGKHENIENRLEYYFNPKLGFLKFVYYTNDGAIVNLYATDIEFKC